MDDERLESVTGQRFARRAARLEGVERIARAAGHAYAVAMRHTAAAGHPI